MSSFNNIRHSVAILCAALLLVPPVSAHTKEGDKLLKLGQKAENQKDYDTALKYYDQALDTDSKDPGYMIAAQRVRGKAADFHIAEGRKLQKAQKLEDALVQFNRAFLDDPSSQIAIQEIHATNEMIKERSRTPAGTPILTPAERARQQLEARINSLEGPPSLRPINNQISSLKMNNQPARVLYESIGKLAGINVLFDPAGIETTGGVGAHNFNLDLHNVTLEEALSYTALETHTFWKAISRNAIFVTQESELKRLEYQDEVVKVFYIQNAASQNELTEIFNAIRQGAKLTTGIFQVAAENAIVVRGSPDTIALVEKLVHDLDKPKPEVVVDVIIMEVARNKTTTLGAAIAGATGGLNVPINFTPRNAISNPSTTTTTTGTTTATGTSTTSGTTASTGTSDLTGLTTGTSSGTSGSYSAALSQVGHVASSDFSVSLPGALVQALMTDASTRILQRPQVRVTDGGKATLKIGSKIPYVSGSLNSAVATPGSIPYATTQFQQIDVGTNIDLQPHVNGPNDVSMHIKVDISNVLTTEDIGGVQQPVLGQKVNEADIRMKDGEVSLLGGLYDEENDNSANGIPGVTNIPLLGYLFGTKVRTRNKDEVLLALIPHIVRAPDTTAQDQEGVFVGSERVNRVERRPDGTPSAPLPGAAPLPLAGGSPALSAPPVTRQNPAPPPVSAPAANVPPQAAIPRNPVSVAPSPGAGPPKP